MVNRLGTPMMVEEEEGHVKTELYLGSQSETAHLDLMQELTSA